MSVRTGKNAPSDLADPGSWVARHGSFLYRYAVSRVGDRALAEDLVQDTLLAALQRVDSFDGRSSPRTWLVSILRHKLADHHRRSSLDDAKLAQWCEEQFSARGIWRSGPRRWRRPTGEEERAELRAALLACLRKLPPETADVFVIHEQRRMPPEDVAESVGVSPASLAARMYRARLAVRACLERHWFSESGRRRGPT